MLDDNDVPVESPLKGGKPAEMWVIVLVIVLSGAAILYRLLVAKRLEQSAALFLGIPALLAIGLALTPKAKSVTGGIMKGITLMLLMVAPLLGEGWFCILIASPIFYAVGLVVGLIADAQRKKRVATMSCVAVLLLPMCLEGVFPALTFDREQTVEVTRVVAGSSDAVEQALSRSPRINAKLPALLRIGFPRPIAAQGEGLEIGSMRVIRFSGVEGAPAGDVVNRVTERRPGFVRTETLSDGSKLAHWMRWESSEVEWQAVDAAHTRVTWRIHFGRQLDPAWYFVPWERAAVHEAASYLIETNATPEAR